MTGSEPCFFSIVRGTCRGGLRLRSVVAPPPLLTPPTTRRRHTAAVESGTMNDFDATRLFVAISRRQLEEVGGVRSLLDEGVSASGGGLYAAWYNTLDARCL